MGLVDPFTRWQINTDYYLGAQPDHKSWDWGPQWVGLSTGFGGFFKPLWLDSKSKNLYGQQERAVHFLRLVTKDWHMSYFPGPTAGVHRLKRRGQKVAHISQWRIYQITAESFFLNLQDVCSLLVTNYLLHSSNMQNTFTLASFHWCRSLYCFYLFLYKHLFIYLAAMVLASAYGIF